MMHRIYKFLAVSGPGDFILKFLMFCAMIVALNYGFHLLWPGIGRFDHWFIITNGVCVGGPFVGLFFLLVRKQTRLQRELSTRSRTDDLTGLSNRRFFLKQAGALLEDGIPGILMIMDVDHFKAVNDTYGHEVGDACLVSIGYRLKRVLRTDDVIGRIGGEEFGVFLANTAPANTSTVCRELLMPIPSDGGAAHPHLTITLSMGAVEAQPGMALDALMRAADAALYRAKANGRARLEFAPRLANANDEVAAMPAPDPDGPTEL